MLKNINASQTKYGIVSIIDLVKEGRLKDYINGTYRKELVIDQPQLKATIGFSEIGIIPIYWDEIKQYQEQIGLFCLAAILFTHENFIKLFSESGTDNMKGVIRRSQFENEKAFTNIRGVLVASGASSEKAIKSDIVSYDFSKLFEVGEVGVLVKQLLVDRLKKTYWVEKLEGNHKEHIRDFFEQCFHYKFHLVFSLEKDQFEMWLNGTPLTTNNQQYLVLDFSNEIEIDTHLLVSLATKPFLILSGASGTGKTYGIRKLASSINPLKHLDPNFNIAFIAVEAGWKDGRNIVGYKNPFSEDGEVYQPTALLNLLLKANSSKFSSVPFFALFDEMNLSHVEMYFARFLALLETSRHEGISSIPLLSTYDLLLLEKYYKNNNEYLEYIYEAIYRGGLYIPANVFFVGTVNIDETTYMFSPKVLDRSFVIERNTEMPSSIFRQSLFGNDVKGILTVGQVNKYLLTTPNVRKLLSEVGKTSESSELHSIISFLDEVYELVESFTFGYRVVVESCEYYFKAKELYSHYNIRLDWLANDDVIFDEILMQKILPKIHGNRKQILSLLRKLVQFCMNKEEVRYKKSYAKLTAMEKNLNISGYCGFIC